MRDALPRPHAPAQMRVKKAEQYLRVIRQARAARAVTTDELQLQGKSNRDIAAQVGVSKFTLDRWFGIRSILTPGTAQSVAVQQRSQRQRTRRRCGGTPRSCAAAASPMRRRARM